MPDQNPEWQCQPEAEDFLLGILEEAKKQNPVLKEFDKDLLEKTSTRLLDWIDYLVIGKSDESEENLDKIGFRQESSALHYRIFSHPGALLPRVVLKDAGKKIEEIAIKVDSIPEFLMIRGVSSQIEGAPYSPFRRAAFSTDYTPLLSVIERRGSTQIEPSYEDKGYDRKYLLAKERWMTRQRNLTDEDEAMHLTLLLAEEIVEELGQDLAACLILECERIYWQSRNQAGQIQKSRQDRLGLGWANHDHHTFRSSRKRFSQLVRLFEMLGFHCRERYYAGKEAGWGAQIMENPRAKLVLFLDVDLKSDEIEIDFAHNPLEEKKELGTIGLWCALHGDSILQAGMHHLEAQFEFAVLKEDLNNLGIKVMDPFSNFPYLKQAFTQGEMWAVNPNKVESLLNKGLISKAQADQFISKGALGSHLENLERKEGYKGFNKNNVSVIIKKTDPRKS